MTDHRTGLPIRSITGDSFSRAVETEAKAGRTLAFADLTQVGQDGDPTDLNLQGATLTGANLNGAILIGADFRRADLTNAKLRGTVQKNSQWAQATLTGIDEAGAETKERKDR